MHPVIAFKSAAERGVPVSQWWFQPRQNFPGFEMRFTHHRADTGRYADFVPPCAWNRGYVDDPAGFLGYLLE